MSTRMATIWDGTKIRKVTWEEAERLEKEDKAQNMSKKTYTAGGLKKRKQFTGYLTRELRAEQPGQPTPPPASEQSSVPSTEPEPSGLADGSEGADWRSYKAEAAAHFGIEKVSKVKKQQVLEYMAEHGIQ